MFKSNVENLADWRDDDDDDDDDDDGDGDVNLVRVVSK